MLAELSKISQVTENPPVSARPIILREVTIFRYWRHRIPAPIKLKVAEKIRYLRSINLSPVNYAIYRSTRLPTVRTLMETHGNDLTEPITAWAIGKQYVTSRHGGRDKVNSLWKNNPPSP